MVVAIPPVEPKDWHHPRVLSDIISPLYTLLYTPIIYTLLCVCCVHIVYTYVLYTIHMCIYTETHRPHTPIPPIHHDTTQHNTTQ